MLRSQLKCYCQRKQNKQNKTGITEDVSLIYEIGKDSKFVFL